MPIKLNNDKNIKISPEMQKIQRTQVAKSSYKIFDTLDINKDKALDFDEISCIEISSKLHNAMDKFGTDCSFEENFKSINSKNIVGVIQYYQQSYNTSLLEDIAHEYEPGGLTIEERLKCLKKIKEHALNWAKDQNLNIDFQALSKDFDIELEKQRKNFGRMNTGNLNNIINSIINPGVNRQNNPHTIREANLYLDKYDKGQINEKELVRQILNSKKMNPEKIVIIDHILQKKMNNVDQQTQIFSQFFFEALNSSKDLRTDNLLKYVNESNLPMIFDKYEKIAEKEDKMNYTYREFHERQLKGKRTAAYWEQTLPQAILNNRKMTSIEKKAFLNHFIDVAEKASKKSNYINEEQKKRYIKDARNNVSKMNFEDESLNSDLYYILVYQLLPVEKSAFQGIRKKILPKEGYEL